MKEQKELTKRDYIMIKKYLLSNEFDMDSFKVKYPNIEIPDININTDIGQHLIFANGYLFSVIFHYNRNFFQIDNKKFFKLDLEQNNFIQVVQFSDIYMTCIKEISKSAIDFGELDEDKTLEDLEDLLNKELKMTLLNDKKDKVSEVIKGFTKALSSSELEEIHEDLKQTIENLKQYSDKFYYYAVDMKSPFLGQGYIIVDSKNNFIEFVRTI